MLLPDKQGAEGACALQRQLDDALLCAQRATERAQSAEGRADSLKAELDDAAQRACMAETAANNLQGQVKDVNQRVLKAEAAVSSLQSQLDAALHANQDAELTLLTLQAQLSAAAQTASTARPSCHTRETQTAPAAHSAQSPESSPALVSLTLNPLFFAAAEQSPLPGPDCASPTHTATSRAASSAVSASRAAEDSAEQDASDEVVPAVQVPRVIATADVPAHQITARDEQCVSAPPCEPPSCQDAVNADSVSTSPPASSVQQTAALLSTADTSTKTPSLPASQPAHPTTINRADSTTHRNDTSPTSVLPCSSQAFSPDRTEEAATPLPQEGTQEGTPALPAGCVKVAQVLSRSSMPATLMSYT